MGVAQSELSTFLTLFPSPDVESLNQLYLRVQIVLCVVKVLWWCILFHFQFSCKSFNGA